MIEKETIKITDSKGFHYEVEVRYQPYFGLAVAYYMGDIILQVEHWKLHQPSGDNDAEWESYEEKFNEWSDMAKTDLYPACKAYFDAK